jgi:HEAT repeat protein
MSLNTLGVDPKRLLPVLTEALKDTDRNIRLSAAYKFQGMGQNAKPAMPALLAALKDDNRDVRHNAFLALLNSGMKLSEALPGIATELKEQNYSHEPIYAYLQALGPDAKEAVPVLIETFGRNQDRLSIARVLGSMGPAAKDALPTLTAFLKRPVPRGSEPTQDAVREALRKISK